MKAVFEYLDYRSYMKDAYEERKSQSPFYSYRIMAESFGLFPSNVFRILHGDAHLPARCQNRALEVLGLTGRSAEYFQLLIAYARERSSRERSRILEKAMALRDVSRRELESRELEYFRHWWTPTLRSALDLTGGRAVSTELGAMLTPPVTGAQAQKTLDLLQELELVKKASSGRLLPSEAHLTAGGEAKARAVRAYQAQILSLARQSLERFSPDERDISTLTVSMDEAVFREVRELVRECRRQIQKSVETSGDPDRVMQLAFAFFPAAKSGGRR